MKLMLWPVLLAGAVLALPASVLIAATPSSQTPAFIHGPCPAPPQPIAELQHARCGTLIVPENRHRPGSPRIRLSVAIIKATSSQPKSDPIIWLAGGPGDDAITEIPMAMAGKLNADRDVIFLSQRGTYTGQPRLTCAAADRWGGETLNMPYNAPATGAAYVAATRACRREVAARTSDLGAYNTLESAGDLEDLRVALQIPKWNVYGISYGTDLALTYLREHPGGIRSVAIDGVFPPSLAGGGAAWTSAGEGINAVFKACEAQAPCRQRFGDIGATFRRLVIQYEASPKTVEVAVPRHAGKVKVKISGGMLLQWAVSPGTHLAAKLPAAIYALAHGDPAPIASTWAAPRIDQSNIGVLGNGIFYGVSCGEWVPYETQQGVIEAGRRAFPTFPVSVLRNAPNLPFMRENCRAWNVPAVSSVVREATQSSVPALVINSQYDGQTAASFGSYVAKKLSHSTVVTIPNIAHVAFGSPSEAANTCAWAITRSFFNVLNAADTSCVRRVPATTFELR
jgi:pimeloyl-ACP methyl ester carboxylesterase